MQNLTPEQRQQLYALFGIEAEHIDPQSAYGRELAQRIHESKMDSPWADVFFAREHPCPELWIMGGPLAAMDRFNVKVRESDLFGQNKSSAAIIREVCAEYDLPVPVKESPAPTLVNVTCPKCGHEKPINPVTQQPIKDAQGRRFAETTCPACGATFKAQLPATPESMQSSAGDLGGGVYLSEVEAARHP